MMGLDVAQAEKDMRREADLSAEMARLLLRGSLKDEFRSPREGWPRRLICPRPRSSCVRSRAMVGTSRSRFAMARGGWARCYSGDQPVQVRARVTGERLLVRVVDRGPGIPSELRERIFEPFEQGDDRRGHDGSGLGLAIVRGFVEANGGRVWPESLPGQGCAFIVELPVPAHSGRGRSELEEVPTDGERST